VFEYSNLKMPTERAPYILGKKFRGMDRNLFAVDSQCCEKAVVKIGCRIFMDRRHVGPV